jgi:hypothetical protein
MNVLNSSIDGREANFFPAVGAKGQSTNQAEKADLYENFYQQ